MNVKMISYSQPTEVKDNLWTPNDIKELVAYCARVSNPANQINTETNDKLLQYLIRHQHWSPFEMVSVCMEIETTRDIARQILRHRSFSFQEFSQRYAEPSEMGGWPFELREARLQDPKNRQNSIEIDAEDFGKGGAANSNELLVQKWYEKQKRVIDAAQDAYAWAITNGIAKEQARCVLPEGNTKSRMYMNGTLRSWIHYIELRGANGTQKEHMIIAKECAKVISSVFDFVK